MIEHTPDTDRASAVPSDPEPEGTGVEQVDDVLASMQQLDDRPVEEHPAIFEQAHQRLRQALDDPAGA